MKKSIKMIFYLLLFSTLIFISIVLTEKTLNINEEKNIAKIQKNMEVESSEETDFVSSNRDKIDEDTKFVYRYQYESTGKYEDVISIAPIYLYNKTLVESEKIIKDWQILEFSNAEVLLEKMVKEDNDKYIIGEYEGNLAVFYKEAKNGVILKDLTSKPISAFPEEIQNELKKGIEVEGDEELIKYMEDLTS